MGEGIFCYNVVNGCLGYATQRRFAGDIFMGVLDEGTVIGVPEKAVPDMIKNFISVISNPLHFTPTIYLEPERLEYEGHTVIHIHVPSGAVVPLNDEYSFDYEITTANRIAENTTQKLPEHYPKTIQKLPKNYPKDCRSISETFNIDRKESIRGYKPVFAM